MAAPSRPAPSRGGHRRCRAFVARRGTGAGPVSSCDTAGSVSAAPPCCSPLPVLRRRSAQAPQPGAGLRPDWLLAERRRGRRSRRGGGIGGGARRGGGRGGLWQRSGAERSAACLEWEAEGPGGRCPEQSPAPGGVTRSPEQGACSPPEAAGAALGALMHRPGPAAAVRKVNKNVIMFFLVEARNKREENRSFSREKI